MKAIQVTFDERLLAAFDATEEVRLEGRSAVLRRAVSEYLRRREEDETSKRYRAAYDDTAALDEEVGGWASQGRWPS